MPRRPDQLVAHHGLTSTEVKDHQRIRILKAVAEIVSEIGFMGMSVEAIVLMAGVSRRTFYELFDGKEDVFLATIREDYIPSVRFDTLVGRRLSEEINQAWFKAVTT